MSESFVELRADQTPNCLGRFPWSAHGAAWTICGSAATAAQARHVVVDEFTTYIRKGNIMSTTVGAAPVQAPPQLSVADLIDRYIKVRDKKEAVQEEHKKQLKPFNEMLAKIEGLLLLHLNFNKLDSVNGGMGTAYKTTHTSVSVKEWTKTLQYIKDFDAWELLEARVNKTAAVEITEELAKQAVEAAAAGQAVDPAQTVIPGIAISQTIAVNVRRS